MSDTAKFVRDWERQAEAPAFIGKSVSRVDAPEKVTGQAAYTLDLVLPKMAYGKLKLSTEPHARVQNVDVSRARALPGVLDILTPDDIPESVRWGVHPLCYDQTPLARGKVRFIGDPVAAVVARDEDCAAEAVERIDVEYEPLPAVFDPEEALADGAPLVHDDKPGNLAVVRNVNLGDLEAAYQEADHVSECGAVTSRQAHCAFETHVSIADWTPDGRLTVWNSTQAPSLCSQSFAKCLGMRESDIRVVSHYVGGGFGGKATSKFSIDFLSIIAARRVSRPVKFYYTREEEFLLATFRSRQLHKVRHLVKNDGTLLARDMEMVVDNGAYSDYGPICAIITAHMGGTLYRMRAYRHAARCVYTNTPPGGAMRGVGNGAYSFGTEVAMDQCAREIGMDPAEFRLKNLVGPDETTIIGAKITSCAARETVREAVRRVDWDAPRVSGNGRRRGLGISCSMHFTGTRAMGPEVSGAYLKMNKDGTVQIMSGTIEMGNGSNTTLSQIAAETLGVALEDIRIVNGDTAVTPYGWGVRGSRTTTIDGMAVYQACRQAKEQLFETASEMLECDPDDLVARDRKIYMRGSPEKSLEIPEVYDKRYNKYGSEAVYTVAHYDAPSEIPNPETGYGNWSSAYAFGTKVAEVEVDDETGQVTVLRVTAVNDTGKVINPEGAAAQLEGGVLMGVGYALTEGLEVEGGQTSNASFVDYKLPATLDAPDLDIALIETEDPNVPWGAKGLGEMAQLGTSAAIANAVYDAVGARVTSLPITPDKVLAAMPK